MKFAIAEKSHEKYIDEAVTAISQDSFWITRLSEAQYNEQFLVTYKELEDLPCSVWNIFSKYGLEFFISKVEAISENIASGKLIFKFEAKEFSNLVRYGSNEQ